MSEAFSTEVTTEGTQTVIHVHGEIDVATCERLRDAIDAHTYPSQSITLDISDVSFMDSSCLNLFAQTHRTFAEDGGSLILRNPTEMATRLLSLTGLEYLAENDDTDNSPAI